MSKVVLIVKMWMFALSILTSYLLMAWVLIDKVGLNLLVSNAFAFSITFSCCLMVYKRWFLNSSKLTLKFILPFSSAALFSLAINEYFVFFFFEHGRLNYLLTIAFATMVSSVFFIAFNLFFMSND